MNVRTALRSAALVLAAGFLAPALLAQAPTASTTTLGHKRVAPKYGGLRPPPEKELIYVTTPGTLEGSWDQNGTGIIVLDPHSNYRFVKRIPTWDVPASAWPMQVAGVTASPVTNMIYVAARGKLGAFDLTTEKMVWENAYDGHCCERPQMSPDSSFMYVGSDLKDFWYVINPKTGELITKVVSPLSPNAHNLNLSRDGKLAFMAPNGKVMGVADATTHKLIKTITFPDNVRVFVVNHDASLLYVNQNNLLGFVIADVKTGQILHRVEVTSYDWNAKWGVSPRPRLPHGCPSHGIMLTFDEKEVWIADGISDYIHIFDNTVMPPKQVASIKTSAGPYWLMPSLDGTMVYSSSAEVFDIKTRKRVAELKDEFGRPLYSEKLLDMVFVGGKLTQVANQFGNGFQPHTAPAPVPPLAPAATKK
jgi:DNA-binding beta-propeller fold protein YncE